MTRAGVVDGLLEFLICFEVSSVVQQFTGFTVIGWEPKDMSAGISTSVALLTTIGWLWQRKKKGSL